MSRFLSTIVPASWPSWPSWRARLRARLVASLTRLAASLLLPVLGAVVVVVGLVGSTVLRASSLSYVPSDCTRVHMVQTGEWLSRFSPNWQAVWHHDGIPNPNLIYPGERICIAWTTSAAAGAAPVLNTLAQNTGNPGAPLPPSAGASGSTVGEPCATTIPGWVWTVNYRYPWTVPPGCYGQVYRPNPSHYVYRPGFGWCNWWAEVIKPQEPTLVIGGNRGLLVTRYARVGSTIFFPPNVEGASPEGHYAHLEAISPDGHYALISEMNFYWRGGGWASVDYRFISLSAPLTYIG